MTMRSFFWPVIASMALTAFSAHAQQRPASSALCGIVNLPGMDCPDWTVWVNQVRDSSGASTVSPQRAPAPTESSLAFTGGGGGALGLVDGRATGTQMGTSPGCHGQCTRRVTFPRPFIGTPTVIATAQPVFHIVTTGDFGECGRFSATHDTRARLISVTPTHFDIFLPGHTGRCSGFVINQLDWIATMQ